MGLGTDILYLLGAAASSPVWGLRLLSTGKHRTDWPARFGRTAPLPPGPRTLLLHAVSVGEVNLLRLLVEQLRDRGGNSLRIVISVTTDTGIARARQLFGDRHAVVRFPFDFSPCVRRFLDAVRPDVVALAENEVWPNFTQECARRGIQVCVINGRLTQRSFSRYRLLLPVVRRMYRRLAAVAAQTSDYARRFTALGVAPQRVTVLDTMKWDTAQVAHHVPGSEELALAMGIDRARPLIVAGSTAPGEDKLLIDTCPPHAQLLLVPRKPEWFEAVARLDPAIVRRTRHPDGHTRPVDGSRLFLLDTMGELRKAYALADVVIVGRSFLGLYGSDMMEPAALAKPTLIGPFHADFADTVAALVAGHGLLVTDRPGEQAARLLADPHAAGRLAENGRRVILSRQGSTARHADMLMRLLEQAATPARD